MGKKAIRKVVSMINKAAYYCKKKAGSDRVIIERIYSQKGFFWLIKLKQLTYCYYGCMQ